ncbi:hypothetical protein ACFV1V_18420 [Streptomyces globisporus]|uniref:hypothetical protein n=1 Tax=Streptomyces globisporus TaxID=1908 RepID=UPI0036913A0A|nr:hypothetical protein OG215_30835 [Streptomyces globisporus]
MAENWQEDQDIEAEMARAARVNRLGWMAIAGGAGVIFLIAAVVALAALIFVVGGFYVVTTME